EGLPRGVESTPRRFIDASRPGRAEGGFYVSRTDQILQRLLALHPKLIDLSLDRINRLLDEMGRPQDCLPPVIHVAGTNGKGSTVAYRRAFLEAAGKRVH